MKLSDKRITTIVNLLKKIYLGLTLFLVLSLVITLIYYPFNLLLTIGFCVGIVTLGSFYFGLRTRQPWIVPVMLLFASLGLLGQIIPDSASLLTFVIKFLFMVLFLLEILFFTRKEVRKYFKAKSIFLFGI